MLGGCLVWGVPGLGGCLVGGVVSQHALRQTPSVNRMTNRCKNNTLPQTSFAGGNDAHSSMHHTENTTSQAIIDFFNSLFTVIFMFTISFPNESKRTRNIRCITRYELLTFCMIREGGGGGGVMITV